jgi:hypothetical protein
VGFDGGGNEDSDLQGGGDVSEDPDWLADWLTDGLAD